MDNYRYREFGELKRAKPVLPWKLFSFSLIFSLAAFLIYYFLNSLYLPSLSKKLSKTRKETHDLINQINAEDKQEMIIFWSQIKNLETILAQHYYPSKLFSLLEENILPEVTLKGISFKVDKNEISLGGVVSNEEILAKQVYVLESLEGFERVIVKNINAELNTITTTGEQNTEIKKRFEIDVYFSKKLIEDL